MACIGGAMDKVKATPCVEVHAAYSECLASNPHKRKACVTLANTLAACAAKHVGKMD